MPSRPSDGLVSFEMFLAYKDRRRALSAQAVPPAAASTQGTFAADVSGNGDAARGADGDLLREDKSAVALKAPEPATR
jgi:hypothetical protein